jgi:ABC-type Zn uptake system ZnuABC Zn-binding protein ZnuA
MKKIFITLLSGFIITSLFVSACQSSATTRDNTGPSVIKVVAVESFLADIAQNIAGDRIKVEALIPLGLDPHAFEPTPRDIVKIAESQVLIANGGGIEEWLDETMNNVGGERLVVEAAAGLVSREAREGELAPDEHNGEDPHYWLDPTRVIKYVENIRDGLIQADPQNKATYTTNAAAYIVQLQELDGWIKQQVDQIPAEKRLIVTNHESFGYFADRYGFKIIGTVIPSVSSGASPSAQQLAQLIDHIRQSGASAIFLETGANPQLADQIAQETGVKVVTGLYTHSITEPGGEAPTYIDMMKYNVTVILDALK